MESQVQDSVALHGQMAFLGLCGKCSTFSEGNVDEISDEYSGIIAIFDSANAVRMYRFLSIDEETLILCWFIIGIIVWYMYLVIWWADR